MGETRLFGAFIDLKEIVTPPNPANDVGRMYVKDVASVTTLFFRDNAGNETDLLSAGAPQTPVAQDIDYAGFDIKNLSNLEFQNTTGAPAGTVRAIYADAGGIILNIPDGSDFNIKFNDVDKFTLSASDLTLGGASLILGASAAIILWGTGESIGIESNDMIFNVTTGDFFAFDVNSVRSLSISSFTMVFGDAIDIVFNTTTGTKIGTDPTEKLAFWDATPVVQQAHIADATDAGSVITQLNLLLAQMATIGLQASS